MENILAKGSLPKWMAKLESYQLYGPVLSEGCWEFALIDDVEGIDLEHTITVHAPKKIVFPQREVYLEFYPDAKGHTGFRQVLPAMKPTIVFGVRPCDGRSMEIMDQVFDGEYRDPYYWERRNQTILVGLACIAPASNDCFCTSVNGSPYSEDGLDILLTDLGDKYFVKSLTDKGNSIIDSAGAILMPVQTEDREHVELIHTRARNKINRHIKNADGLAVKLKQLASDHPVQSDFGISLWDAEAMRCIECGICTYLCPTCHCFDISDEVTHNHPLRGKRVRTWDSCQFPEFTNHSSGHNPRPDKASRLRQRIAHKFQYFVENYGISMCVGCGRCITKCPVGIDIIDILDKVAVHG